MRVQYCARRPLVPSSHCALRAVGGGHRDAQAHGPRRWCDTFQGHRPSTLQLFFRQVVARKRARSFAIVTSDQSARIGPIPVGMLATVAPAAAARQTAKLAFSHPLTCSPSSTHLRLVTTTQTYPGAPNAANTAGARSRTTGNSNLRWCRLPSSNPNAPNDRNNPVSAGAIRYRYNLPSSGVWLSARCSRGRCPI